MRGEGNWVSFNCIMKGATEYISIKCDDASDGIGEDYFQRLFCNCFV